MESDINTPSIRSYQLPTYTVDLSMEMSTSSTARIADDLSDLVGRAIWSPNHRQSIRHWFGSYDNSGDNLDSIYSDTTVVNQFAERARGHLIQCTCRMKQETMIFYVTMN